MADIKIQTTQGYVATGGIKFLVYSRPHKGKTDMIKTLPRPIVFASEHGLVTLAKYDIPYTTITTVAELQSLILWVKEGKFVGKYDSIVLDSLSYLTTLLLSEFRNNTAKYTNNGQKHYGMMREYITDLIDALYAANVHVYVTAWEEDKYDAFGNMVCTMPATEGKALQTYLVHYFDLTAHLDWHTMDVPQLDGTTLKQEMPFLQTVEANGKFARSRNKGLAAFEAADLGALLAKIQSLHQNTN